MTKRRKNIEVRIDNAHITFRNFAGAEGQYNPAGNRNFCVFLSEDVGKQMDADGWNIKWIESRDEYEDAPPRPMVQVRVNFGNFPPNIVLVSDGKMTRLTEENVNLLDFADLDQVDLILRGYEWEVSGKKGIKAYLKTGYFVLHVDELAKKYANALDSAQESIGGCGECAVCDGSCGGGLHT